MDWLNEYVMWCKSFADNFTEINVETSDYVNLANAVGGSLARCFIDKDDNLWITTPHPQACLKSRINAAIKEYNVSHGVRIIEEEDNSLLARNFGAKFQFQISTKVYHYKVINRFIVYTAK